MSRVLCVRCTGEIVRETHRDTVCEREVVWDIPPWYVWTLWGEGGHHSAVAGKLCGLRSGLKIQTYRESFTNIFIPP